MSDNSSTIISKVWEMCDPLRDDGVSYGDYLEQLTYLIFLKMSDEYTKPPYKKETGIPTGYRLRIHAAAAVDFFWRHRIILLTRITIRLTGSRKSF